jgi:hypothetical protein
MPTVQTIAANTLNSYHRLNSIVPPISIRHERAVARKVFGTLKSALKLQLRGEKRRDLAHEVAGCPPMASLGFDAGFRHIPLAGKVKRTPCGHCN